MHPDLDSLSVLDGEFPGRTGKWRRFLIPVRLRSPFAAHVELQTVVPDLRHEGCFRKEVRKVARGFAEQLFWLGFAEISSSQIFGLRTAQILGSPKCRNPLMIGCLAIWLCNFTYLFALLPYQSHENEILTHSLSTQTIRVRTPVSRNASTPRNASSGSCSDSPPRSSSHSRNSLAFRS